MESGVDLWVWSVAEGIQSGILADDKAVKDTEHPAAALYHMIHNIAERYICVVLDMANHLGEKKTVRLLRELIAKFRNEGNVLIMIDHTDDVPDIIASHSSAF